MPPATPFRVTSRHLYKMDSLTFTPAHLSLNPYNLAPIHHVHTTVKPVLRDHCDERPPVLKDHTFLAAGPTFQYNHDNWTCHQIPSAWRDHTFVVNWVVFQDRFYLIVRPTVTGSDKSEENMLVWDYITNSLFAVCSVGYGFSFCQWCCMIDDRGLWIEWALCDGLNVVSFTHCTTYM